MTLPTAAGSTPWALDHCAGGLLIMVTVIVPILVLADVLPMMAVCALAAVVAVAAFDGPASVDVQGKCPPKCSAKMSPV
jgi:hypothetical protein